MTYLFWSNTKTINFMGFAWLFDVKYARSIIYDCFVQIVVVFNQRIWPF
jgi:hypothetical protein